VAQLGLRRAFQRAPSSVAEELALRLRPQFRRP
jgi:hypothetical protein